MLTLAKIDAAVLEGAKWAFTTRRVGRAAVAALQPNVQDAVSGDLVLGEIVAVGQHKKVQLAEGRFSEAYVGDRVVMVCGDRYAPDQFEGVAEIGTDVCDVIAGGGVLGRMVQAHAKMAPPTKVRPLGLLADVDGEAINLASFALPAAPVPDRVTVIGIFGTSMNAGKTTAAASLAHGLKRAGYGVAGVKATGTGAFGDYNAFLDAGVPVLDFTDVGMVSTYKMPLERIEAGFETLVGTAAARGAEIVVVEIADGVFQAETAEILRCSRIKDRLDTVLFAAPDALSAVGGVATLRGHGLEPFAVSGVLTCSPLAAAEAAAAAGIVTLARDELRDPGTAVAALAGVLGTAAPLAVAA